MKDTDMAIQVSGALIDLGVRGYTEDLSIFEKVDISKYPSLHAGIYEAVKKGEYRLIDVYGIEDLGFVDAEGRRYYSMLEVSPFERRLVYTFEYGGINFALLHPIVARALNERMAVEGITDPDLYTKRIEEAHSTDFHIEGYVSEPYELFIPIAAFKNLDTLITKYAQEVDIRPEMRQVGVLRNYVLSILSVDYRHFPRTLPSLNFRFNSALAILSFVTIKNSMFIYAVAYSWSRLNMLKEFLDRFLYPSSKDYYLFYPPKKYRGEDYEPGPIFLPEGVPKPAIYTEIARFYNRLMEYEIDGKPLSEIKKENPVLYSNVIRTFAYIEARLQRLKATAFPYDTIVRRYL